MCTVSIISLGGPSGFRIVCNRDESRRRPPAAPPKWRAHEGSPVRAIWPMDLEAGGTWIAASERGLALCLLNLNPDPPVDSRGPATLRSRGLLIPDLIHAGSMEEATQLLARHNLSPYAPFRLVGVDASVSAGATGPVVLEARWDRSRLTTTLHRGFPICFVSSGLGDALVTPRLDVFEELVCRPGPTAARQDAFHRHRWPDRPQLSVLMSRADARTVSIATLEVRPDPAGTQVQMHYEPIVDHTPPQHPHVPHAPVVVPARARIAPLPVARGL